ncbi:anti-sigma factor family protein [Streptomyces longwoodensis]|uniref:anti-sigma factor family protein n=1 Tax=Streptomyces longwoodensis TaxID=68231 RepID=UPI0033FCF8C8
MTSTTDTTGHPDVTEISDLTDGLLGPSRSEEIRQHLAACELCADVQASLEEIRGLLGTLPGPARMPDDVAQRIDAALAAEALLDAEALHTAGSAETSGSSEATGSSETSGATAHVSRETTPVSRETSVPAPDRPSGHARSSSTGPGRKERKRPGRRKIAVLGAVFGAAALGLGSVLVASLSGGGDGGTTASSTHSTAADTFSRTALERQVTALLSKNEGSRAPHSLGLDGDSEPPRVFTQPTVPACVQQGIGRQDTALATQTGVYQGRDVLLVVLPDPADTGKVTAYLVDTRCVQHPGARAKVLLQHTYARP